MPQAASKQNSSYSDYFNVISGFTSNSRAPGGPVTVKRVGLSQVSILRKEVNLNTRGHQYEMWTLQILLLLEFTSGDTSFVRDVIVAKNVVRAAILWQTDFSRFLSSVLEIIFEHIRMRWNRLKSVLISLSIEYLHYVCLVVLLVS